MTKARISRGEVFEGQEFDIRELVGDKDGFALTNAVVVGYEMKVFDLSNGAEEVLTVPAGSSLNGILFDVPITTGWDVNSQGYNFNLPIRPVDWPIAQIGGHSYKFEILLDTLTLAGKVPVVAIVEVVPMEL